MTNEDTRIHGIGFGAVADLYDAIRPTYPVESVRALTESVTSGPTSGSTAGPTSAAGPALDVADIGAGTGKMTAVIASLGHRVTAVEPDARMLDTLRFRVPDAVTIVGTAERTGLATGSADVVVIAQAFHWTHRDEAMREFARVVRPGGVVGLVWNTRDPRVGWVQRFDTLLESVGDGAMGRQSSTPDLTDPQVLARFEPEEHLTFEFAQQFSADALVDAAASRSYVIALPERRRLSFLDAVRTFALTDPDLADRATFDQPYVTHVYRFRRRP